MNKLTNKAHSSIIILITILLGLHVAPSYSRPLSVSSFDYCNGEYYFIKTVHDDVWALDDDLVYGSADQRDAALFKFECNSRNNTVAIQAENNRYIRIDPNTRKLETIARSARSYESLRIHQNGATYNFATTHITPAGSADGYFVAAEPNSTILANRTEARGWERFTILPANGPGGSQKPTDKIQLPIEVLGSAGTQKRVTVELNDPTNITHLYLRCNACGYHDINHDKNLSKTKATVRINNGPTIALKHFIEKDRVYGNRGIRILGGEANYGGIGGGFRTVRMLVPITGLQKGINTITFEHRHPEPPSIGFRIIALNFIEDGNLARQVLNEMDFIDDDPNDWAPPRTTSNAIGQGAALWAKRNTLYDPHIDHMDGQGEGRGALNGRIRASCADCHAANGRDLKYFNFSNESIIERSKFHGLSQEEGELIASYIRNLSIPIVNAARPWHPAYQPGPNLDSRPAYEWAAGAGVDAILDRDADMAPHLFPEGTSLNAVRRVVDRYDTLNLRELPITIPLPEWNQWLPIIHPDDAFDTSLSAIRTDYRGRAITKPYYTWLYDNAREQPTRQTIGAMTSRLKPWLRRGLTCQVNGVKRGEPWRALNGDVMNALRLPSTNVTTNTCQRLARTKAVEPHEIAKRGLAAWTSVKMWEIIHGRNLEQASQRVGRRVCSDGRCIDASEPRGWVVDGRNLFDRTPHFLGTAGFRHYFSQNELQGIFESNAWYRLNMIINPGYRTTMPSHFAYTYSHVELLQFESGIDQGFLFWSTMIKQRQLQTNGVYGQEAGLDLRTAQPYIYYGTARNRTRTDTQRSVGRALWGRIAQAMIEDFVADANNANANDWTRSRDKVQSRSSTNFSACATTCTFDLGPYQGRNTYRVIPKLREIGVENSAITRLINWSEKTWPNGPWRRVR